MEYEDGEGLFGYKKMGKESVRENGEERSLKRKYYYISSSYQ